MHQSLGSLRGVADLQAGEVKWRATERTHMSSTCTLAFKKWSKRSAEAAFQQWQVKAAYHA